MSTKYTVSQVSTARCTAPYAGFVFLLRYVVHARSWGTCFVERVTNQIASQSIPTVVQRWRNVRCTFDFRTLMDPRRYR